MIGTEFLREVVETAILTGKLKNQEPVSLLLIAAPESGKTSVVLSKECKSVEAFSDVTGRGLHEIVKANSSLTHIVINDMVALLSHKESVNRYTLSQLNAITEEGISSIATPHGIERFTAGKRGIIASLTLDLIKDSRRWWSKIGFTSRMLPFCYRYTPDLIIRIKDSIDVASTNGLNGNGNGNGHSPPKIRFPVPQNKILVHYSERWSKDVRLSADLRCSFLREQGMRRLKQYHAMACAHALWRNRKSHTVNEIDVEFIRKLDRYVNYDNPEPLR